MSKTYIIPTKFGNVYGKINSALQFYIFSEASNVSENFPLVILGKIYDYYNITFDFVPETNSFDGYTYGSDGNTLVRVKGNNYFKIKAIWGSEKYKHGNTISRAAAIRMYDAIFDAVNKLYRENEKEIANEMSLIRKENQEKEIKDLKEEIIDLKYQVEEKSEMIKLKQENLRKMIDI